MSLLDIITKPAKTPKVKDVDAQFADITSAFEVDHPAYTAVGPLTFKMIDKTKPLDVQKITSFDSLIAKANGLSTQLEAMNKSYADVMSTVHAAITASNQEWDERNESDEIKPDWVRNGYTVIDRARALELIEQVAAEHPLPSRTDEHGRFTYFDENGAPSCILGHVFHRLGFNRSSLADHVRGGEIVEAIDYLVDDYNVGGLGFLGAGIYPSRMRMPPAAQAVFRSAQLQNDRHIAWSDIAANQRIGE